MRLLVDNNPSVRMAAPLAAAGWDVVHVRERGLQAASDAVVLRAALDERRVPVSADTDLGQLLARSRASAPSVVLVGRVVGRRVEELADVLLAHLPRVESELETGCVVATGEESLRVRSLPLG